MFGSTRLTALERSLEKEREGGEGGEGGEREVRGSEQRKDCTHTIVEYACFWDT